MLNYKQIWHGIKPIRWLNKFNLTKEKRCKKMTIWQETTGNSKMPHAEAHTKEIDELTLKSLAKSIFELQQSECSVDLGASSLSNSSEASTSCSVVNVLNSQPFLFHNYVLIVL